MSLLILPCATALWLGLVTSISPCPLATNVAAISLISRQVGNRRRALAGAIAYTLGRIAVYVALALILSLGLASMPRVAGFLREEIVPVVGPLLILVGMAMVGWLPLPPISLKLGNSTFAQRISHWGILGEFALGGVFALSFCPVSAALFFGSLIPLALPSPLPWLVVSFYGTGTALPVGIIALVLVLSTSYAASILGRIQSAQKWANTLTAIILIAVGTWLTISETIVPVLQR
ncbi:MAG: aromatic aminobenezylarsenical efflux permease ArsG family transporter [Verrucomicrobiota bacterium]|nr:aromatic aminobenezylarsenical efflux permease ArsG family transporter [Verrucomicrobiota bacterium]